MCRKTDTKNKSSALYEACDNPLYEAIIINIVT